MTLLADRRLGGSEWSSNLQRDSPKTEHLFHHGDQRAAGPAINAAVSAHGDRQLTGLLG